MRKFSINVQGKEVAMKVFMAFTGDLHMNRSGRSWWQIRLSADATPAEMDKRIRDIIGPVPHANVVEVL